jgi:hypothetical protein
MEKIYITINDKKIEATGEVLEQILLDRENAKISKMAQEAEIKAQAQARSALLQRLGITAEEAALLLG